MSPPIEPIEPIEPVQPILVINPNSTESVTQGIDAALSPLRMLGAPEIECRTLLQGPPAIESQADIDSVVEPISDLIGSSQDSASAFVIACFSDPGLARARTVSRRPVLGIAECAMVTALTRGARFGIVSILEASIPRHARAVAAAGLEARLAGDLAINLGVLELADEARTEARLTTVGAELRDRYGADVLVLGCAGMAGYRSRLERALGLPVIDPTQAAVTLAIGAVQLQ